MKKWLTLLLAAMLLFTVAFADGNDKITLTEEMGEIVRGGVLTMAKSKGLDAGLNIAKISDCSSDFPVMAQIYEGLLTIDETGNVAPGLATEWAFADDGLSMNMKLREDVSFSNGEKFNAEAVAKCLNYYISAECGHVFKGSDLSLIAGVDVVGEYEVKINLSAVDAALGLELAGSSGYIMAPSVIDKGEMNTNPIGTGPFVLKEYKEGESIELVANPNYYKMGADGKPLPYLDGIKYIVITDDTTKTTNLLSGDLDGVDRHGSTTSVLAAQAADNMATYQCPITNVYNISMNLHYEPLKDIRVRQAIAYALNGQEIVDIAMEGLGEMTPFWTDGGKWFYNEYNPHTYDPEKAKALLKEAGAEGLELELAIIAREPDNTVAQLVQYQLSDVGINVKINALDSASWVALVRNETNHQICISLSGNAGYDPAKGWVIPLKSFGDAGKGLELVDGLKKLLDDQKVNTNQEERVAMMEQFQKTILDECLTVIVGNKFQYGSFANYVKNVKFNYYGWYEFGETYIAK